MVRGVVSDPKTSVIHKGCVPSQDMGAGRLQGGARGARGARGASLLTRRRRGIGTPCRCPPGGRIRTRREMRRSKHHQHHQHQEELCILEARREGAHFHNHLAARTPSPISLPHQACLSFTMSNLRLASIPDLGPGQRGQTESRPTESLCLPSHSPCCVWGTAVADKEHVQGEGGRRGMEGEREGG